jgi:hypothetical protein
MLTPPLSSPVEGEDFGTQTNVRIEPHDQMKRA